MDFHQLHGRLIAALRNRIRNGEYTERQLARMVGISQPHLHNVLKEKRFLSPALASQILRNLHMDLLDLLEEKDIEEWRRRHPDAVS